ncbi:MAG TPA: YdcF family protein [Terriglobia bacterium]|nr:YdcF family protein [Terriglobia bacterium]
MLRKAAIVIVVIGVAAFLLLRFGGYLLVKTDPLPAHAPVAVVLNGSIQGVLARTAGGVRLLQAGKVDHLMLSVPALSYWGENVPEVANRFFEKHFGNAIASRVVYCVSDAESTLAEAEALSQCLGREGWRQVVVVTSNYHTRRAGRIWRAAGKRAHPGFEVYMDGVFDGSYQPRGWWRRREYAKTWLLETSKLVWETIFGIGPWKNAPSKGRIVQPGATLAPSKASRAPLN